jgi:hypothetical protein
MAALEAPFAAMRFALELMGEKNGRESDQRYCYHDAYHRFSHGSLRFNSNLVTKSLGDLHATRAATVRAIGHRQM